MDLNGDGWDEIVSAYRDWNNELAVRSEIWHPGAAYTSDRWIASRDRLQGNDVKYVDVAAGKLKEG